MVTCPNCGECVCVDYGNIGLCPKCGTAVPYFQSND